MEGDDDGKEWLRKYVGEQEITWPNVAVSQVWYDEPFEEYDVGYLPYSLLIDRDGNLVDTDVRGKRLDPAIEELLEGAAD